jgi:hypothetical protein
MPLRLMIRPVAHGDSRVDQVASERVKPRANLALLRDDSSLGGIRMELAHEGISPRFEFTKAHHALAAASYDLLHTEGVRIEFVGRRVLVLDQELASLAGGNMYFRWRKSMIPENDLDLALCVGRRQRVPGEGRRGEGDDERCEATSNKAPSSVQTPVWRILFCAANHRGHSGLALLG